MLGPIDYVAVSFKGSNFDGSILETLVAAVEQGTIRVVDLSFAIKDAEGNLLMADIEDQDDELKEIAELLGIDENLPLLTESDMEKIGKIMDNDTAVALLVIEQLWAKDLKEALIEKNAEVLAEGRIHPEIVAAAVEELDEQKVKVA